MLIVAAKADVHVEELSISKSLKTDNYSRIPETYPSSIDNAGMYKILTLYMHTWPQTS